jgi:hypothetical protein
MNLRGRMPTVLFTLWIVSASLVYFQQFTAPVLRYLSRTVAHQ